MKRKGFFSIILCVYVFISTLNVQSQESNVKINVAADIVSRYVWRGLDYGASPNIQPTLSLTAGGFEVGGWGAISTLGTYSEVDLYAKYTISKFSLGVTDYFFPGDGVPSSDGLKYYNWDNTTTGHSKEAKSYRSVCSPALWFMATTKKWKYLQPRTPPTQTIIPPILKQATLSTSKARLWMHLLVLHLMQAFMEPRQAL